MPSPRAPLFSVSLAFALGCVIGLDGWISLSWALGIFAILGLVWLRQVRRENASLAAFFALVASAGIIHTILVSTTILPTDLRRLPDDKTYPTTQWQGIVFTEPVAEVTTHTPKRALDRTSFIFRVQRWRPTGGRYFEADISTPWRPASGDIACTMTGPVGDLHCGDQLQLATALAPFDAPLVPGALDFRAYEAEQGIYYRATIAGASWRRIAAGGGNFWQNLSFRARDWAYARLQIGLEDDPRIADFLAGMLIGYRQEIPADIEQDFRSTGTLHVFAVSGQNIAELMVVAIVLLQLFGFMRWRWAWLLAPLVVLYCLLTGSPASAIRATVMVLAILLAWRLDRPLHALGCWSLAFLAMLLWNPAILLDPGAQLSFGVVLGLILLGPRLMRVLQKPFARDPFLPRELLSGPQRFEDGFWHHGAQILGATIAATVVSEPITAIDFHQVTPVSVLANLVVVPTAGLITVVGTLAITCSLITTTWAALLNNANWLFARLLIAFVAFLAHEPGASINVPDVRTLSSPLPSFLVAPLQDSACLLVRTRTQTWLFNTGREAVAKNITSHLLQFYGINRLDGLVLTQVGVADNSGADVIVRNFHPRRLIVPLLRTHSLTEKTLPALVALSGRPLEFWQRGGHVELADGISLDVLNPAAASGASRADDRSLVLLFHCAEGNLLWASRIDSALQQELLADNPHLRADVLILDPASTPSSIWLDSLQVRHWFQFPRRDRQLNSVTKSGDDHAGCQLWPLDQTGAVQISFTPHHASDPAKIFFRPWAGSARSTALPR